MSEEQQQEQERVKRYPIKQSAGFAGGAAVTMALVDAIAHLGPTGLLISGLAGYVAWKHGPQLYEFASSQVREIIPPHPEDEPEKQAELGDRKGRTFWDRAMGRYPEMENGQAQEVAPLPDPTPEYDVYTDLDTTMNFGPTLRPDANKVLSGRKVLFGVSDAGKSNNITVICEECGRFEVPLFLFDTEGEYRHLCRRPYFPHPVHVTRDKIKPDRAYAFAQWAMGAMKQVVIDLSTYDDDEAAWMMINIIKGVRDFEEAQSAEEHGVRLPCEIILDEATVWLPQSPNQSSLNKIMVNDPEGKSVDENGKAKQVSLLSLLERAFFSVVVRRGRKRGMGFTLATQRIAEINKSALSANWIILMRQTQAADFEVYKKFGISAEDALSLKQGEAFVSAPGQPFERHQFRRRRSDDGAATPGLKELRKHQQRLAAQPAQPWQDAPQRSSVTFEQDIAQPIPEDRPMPKPDEESNVMDRLAIIRNLRAAQIPEEDIPVLLGISPRDYQALITLKRRITDAPLAAAPVPMVSKEERYEQDLMTALDHWRTLTSEGKQCGFRTLRKLTGWPEKKCRDLLADLENRGYISRQKVEEEDAE